MTKFRSMWFDTKNKDFNLSVNFRKIKVAWRAHFFRQVTSSKSRLSQLTSFLFKHVKTSCFDSLTSSLTNSFYAKTYRIHCFDDFFSTIIDNLVIVVICFPWSADGINEGDQTQTLIQCNIQIGLIKSNAVNRTGLTGAGMLNMVHLHRLSVSHVPKSDQTMSRCTTYL
jgi:hypothetical protein